MKHFQGLQHEIFSSTLSSCCRDWAAGMLLRANLQLLADLLHLFTIKSAYISFFLLLSCRSNSPLPLFFFLVLLPCIYSSPPGPDSGKHQTQDPIEVSKQQGPDPTAEVIPNQGGEEGGSKHSKDYLQVHLTERIHPIVFRRVIQL